MLLPAVRAVLPRKNLAVPITSIIALTIGAHGLTSILAMFTIGYAVERSRSMLPGLIAMLVFASWTWWFGWLQNLLR